MGLQPLFVTIKSTQGSVRRLSSRRDVLVTVYAGDESKSEECGSIYIERKSKDIHISISDGMGTPLTDAKLNVP